MKWSATSAQARIRTRSGCCIGAPETKLCERRLAVAPDALLERAAQLGLVRLANQVAARWWSKVGYRKKRSCASLKGLSGCGWHALAEGDELLAFRQGADGDSPFFESNWHGGECGIEGNPAECLRDATLPGWAEAADALKIRNLRENPKYPCKSRGFFERFPPTACDYVLQTPVVRVPRPPR